MKRIKSVLTLPNIGAGYLYFYVHFITEIICFFVLTNLMGNSQVIWLIPFVYDALAFVPQSMFGFISDKYSKIPMGIIGTILLVTTLILYSLNINNYLILGVLCIGNCLLHINGAEVTIRASKGKLSHSAIFVAGGSFGVITGKILADIGFNNIFLILIALTMIPCIMLAEYYRKETKEKKCDNYNYHNKKYPESVIILLTIFIIIVRGYMGYGIPTSWNKTLFESILLYCTMGIGKALGGVLSDLIGVRKTATISTLISLPFLIIGDNNMVISLIGVMFFSMTMAITLGVLVSVLKRAPGLAFGLTTIGLFLGTAPIFFFKIDSFLMNTLVIIILTIICFLILMLILRKESREEVRNE